MFLHIESILPVVFLSIFPYAHFTGESFSPMYEKRQAQTEQERESFPTKCNAEVNDGRFSLIFTHAHTASGSLSMQMRSSVAVGNVFYKYTCMCARVGKLYKLFITDCDEGKLDKKNYD